VIDPSSSDELGPEEVKKFDLKDSNSRTKLENHGSAKESPFPEDT